MAPTEDDRKPSADSMTGEATDAQQASSTDETPPSGLQKSEEAMVSSPTDDAGSARLPESSHGCSDNGMSGNSSSSETSKKDGKAPPGHAFDQMENVDLPKFVKDHNGTLTFPEKVR